MKIGIYSGFDTPGGSEMRCAHMCTFLNRLPDTEACLLAHGDIHKELLNVMPPGSLVRLRARTADSFSDIDSLLVVNSCNSRFTRKMHWDFLKDKPPAAITFLFNFVPALKYVHRLPSLKDIFPSVRLLTASAGMLEKVRHNGRLAGIPMGVALSPVDHTGFSTEKSLSDTIRIGRHSLKSSGKLNPRYPELIREISARFPGKVSWDFLGVPDSFRASLEKEGVVVREPYSISVQDYLREIDLMCVYARNTHMEAWSRSILEGLLSGCPVVANDEGGNREQVLSGESGFLCSSFEDYVDKLSLLISDKELRREMSIKARAAGESMSASVSVPALRKFLELY